MGDTGAELSAKRRSYHHPDLRQAIIAGAVEMIAERDGPQFSLRELATRLGVSHTSVYRHFADKDALLESVSEQGFARLNQAQIAAQADVTEDPLDQLRALCWGYIRFARDDAGFFALMFHSRPASERARRARDVHNDKALDTLVSTIRACQQAGAVIDGNPRRMAAYLALGAHGLASFLAQGHVPGFIVEHREGPLSISWLAELSLQPLLTRPQAPAAIARRFFDAP